jgi:hypothetical protein
MSKTSLRSVFVTGVCGVIRLEYNMNRDNLSKREFTKLRKSFEKLLLKELSQVIKGSGWRKNQNTIFRQKEGYFYVATFSVYLNDEVTKIEFSVKPMGIDPLFWEITGMRDNENQPLSFRAWAAFRCPEIPIEEFFVTDGSEDESKLSNKLFNWVQSRITELNETIDKTTFSELVKNHKNQKERGAYAITLITTLIAEGSLTKALELAKDYEAGQLTSGYEMSFEGTPFYTLAIDWLSKHAKVV